MLDVRRKQRTGLWRRERSRRGGAHCYLRVVGRRVHFGRENSCSKRSSPGKRERVRCILGLDYTCRGCDTAGVDHVPCD